MEYDQHICTLLHGLALPYGHALLFWRNSNGVWHMLWNTLTASQSQPDQNNLKWNVKPIQNVFIQTFEYGSKVLALNGTP